MKVLRTRTRGQGARRVPALVPIFPDDPAVADNRRAWLARGQRHVTIEGAGHFLQEDDPAAFAKAIVDFCRNNPI